MLRPENATQYAYGVTPSKHYESLGRLYLVAVSSVRAPPSAGRAFGDPTLRWLPVPQDFGQCVFYAVLVLASEELRVYSVEDDNAHECGTEKFHLSLPICGEKIDQRTPEYRRTVSNSFRDVAKGPKASEGDMEPKDVPRL